MEHSASRCEPDGEHRIAFGGVLDRAARRDILTEAAALRLCEHDSVTIDLRAVEAIDAEGLEAFGKVVDITDGRQGTVVVVGASPPIRAALTSVGLGDAVRICV